MQTCSFNSLIMVDAAIIENKDETLAGEWRHVEKLEPGANRTETEDMSHINSLLLYTEIMKLLSIK